MNLQGTTRGLVKSGEVYRATKKIGGRVSGGGPGGQVGLYTTLEQIGSGSTVFGELFHYLANEANPKNDKTSDIERPFKNKNYTLQELKKISEEAKKSYNVFFVNMF